MTDEEMTNEEMADKHAEEYCRQDDLGHFIRTTEEVKKAYIDGFLAGLKEGKPKWHKVADGDLPNDNRTVFDEAGDRFYYFRGHFYYENDSIFDRQPIAWCEIPQFKE